MKRREERFTYIYRSRPFGKIMLRLSAENSGEKPIFRHEINGHRIALRMDGLCVLELGEH